MSKEELDTRLEMIGYIRENEVYYIADLWAFAEKERADDWFSALRNRKTYKFMKLYLSEFRASARRMKKTMPAPKNSWHDM